MLRVCPLVCPYKVVIIQEPLYYPVMSCSGTKIVLYFNMLIDHLNLLLLSLP